MSILNKDLTDLRLNSVAYALDLIRSVQSTTSATAHNLIKEAEIIYQYLAKDFTNDKDPV